MTRFDAPWDRRLRAGTWIGTAILCASAVGVPALGRALGGPDAGLLSPLLLAPLVAAAVLGASWALAPRGFAVEGADLVVVRPLRPVRIPLARIRSVDLLPAEAAASSVRVAGNAGLFGWYGRFWSRRLGAFRMYATRLGDLVRVDTDDERFVLSPGAPEAFVDAVLARAPGARRGPAPDRRTAPGAGPARRLVRAVVLALAALVAVVAAVFLVLRGLSPVGADVAGDAVRIERRWAGPVTIPLATVRSAEVMAPQVGRRWWRTNGTAMGAVRFGRFASRELGPFQLWAWRHGPYVLLETDDGRVVLTPDDPQRFVAEIRDRLRR